MKKIWEDGHLLTDKPSVISEYGWTIRLVDSKQLPQQLKTVSVERSKDNMYLISLSYKDTSTGILLSDYYRSDNEYVPKLTVINQSRRRYVPEYSEDWILGDPDAEKTWGTVLFEHCRTNIKRYVTFRKVTVVNDGNPTAFYEVISKEETQ